MVYARSSYASSISSAPCPRPLYQDDCAAIGSDVTAGASGSALTPGVVQRESAVSASAGGDAATDANVSEYQQGGDIAGGAPPGGRKPISPWLKYSGTFVGIAVNVEFLSRGNFSDFVICFPSICLYPHHIHCFEVGISHMFWQLYELEQLGSFSL